LESGTNVITVTAQDAAGNRATDTLTVTYSAPATTTPIVLTASLYDAGRRLKAALQWSTVGARSMDIFLNGRRVTRTSNDGSHVDSPKGTAPYTYKVCVAETIICSNTISLQ
jgi:hypothetical protein